MNTTVIQDHFYHYMVSGIIEANLFMEGGLQCYQQIPFPYHLAFVVVLVSLHLFFIFKYKKYLSYHTQEKNPSKNEKRFALFCFLSWLITCLFKVQTRKGLFMLNPCHMALLIQIYLHFNKNTYLNRIIHTCWTGWLFGAYMALFIPHLQALQDFEVMLYYYEHIVIIPLGYLVLNKRYGFLKPTVKNHLPAFSSIALYQFLVLVPVSRINMVNLNFALCHSTADPTFPIFGIYYFIVCTLSLNVFSLLARWLAYIQIKIVYGILSILNVKSPQIKIDNLSTEETPQGPQKIQKNRQKNKQA